MMWSRLRAVFSLNDSGWGRSGTGGSGTDQSSGGRSPNLPQGRVIVRMNPGLLRVPSVHSARRAARVLRIWMNSGGTSTDGSTACSARVVVLEVLLSGADRLRLPAGLPFGQPEPV